MATPKHWQDEQPMPQRTSPNNESGEEHSWSAFTGLDYAAQVRAHAYGTFFVPESYKLISDFLAHPYRSQLPPGPSTESRPGQAGAANNSTGNSRTRPRQADFVSLFKISGEGVAKAPFTTLDEFNDLGDEILPDESNFVILLLQGYPEAQWLAAVGAKFRIDPEFFHRHLIFTSTIDQYDSMKRRTIPRNTPTNMPSPCDEGLMSVQITRVGHWGDRYIGPVGWLMRRTEVRMREERFNMAQLYPDSKSKPRHRSIIREFSHHEYNFFSVEQTLSIAVHRLGNGWTGILWHDEALGNDLHDFVMSWGPWNPNFAKPVDSIESLFLPLPIHSPFPPSTNDARHRGKNVNHTPAVNSSSSAMKKGILELTLAEQVLSEYPRILVDIEKALCDPVYALTPLLRLAAASEMDLLAVVDLAMQENDKGIANGTPTIAFSSLIYHQKILKRHIQYMKATIRCITNWASSVSRSCEVQSPGPGLGDTDRRPPTSYTGPDPTHPIHSILADYEHALAYAETLLQDCVQGMSVAAHRMSIKESEKAIAEARDVTRLSRLATIFVPLTFVTSVFGMNVRELAIDDGPPIWVWVVSTVIFGAATWWILERHYLNAAVARRYRLWKEDLEDYWRKRRGQRAYDSE